MNWSRVFTAGVVGGIVMTLADWVMHGFIMGNAYRKYSDVFRQDEAGAHYFFLVGIMVALMAAILFGKTRSAWAAGAAGGATFGFFLGLVAFFTNFYETLVIEGFPYHLSWCWGGMNLISFTILGIVFGFILKRE